MKKLAEKFNVYQAVTDKIIAELEKGKIPWHKPWVGGTSLAVSRSTGKPYSLLNQMLLGLPGEYLTFKQVKEAGGKVKKGEKASIVVFWKMLPVKEKDKNTNIEVEKVIPLLRYFNVFHISQCEGVASKRVKEEPVKKFKGNSFADGIIADYCKREQIQLISSSSNEAFYRSSTDSVNLPLRTQFEVPEEYYSTAFHELGHSTGAKKRLNRDMGHKFGTKAYSKEELVAELTATFALNTLGLDVDKTFTNSVAYIQSWINNLKNDNHLIVVASSQAEKAVHLIFGDGEEIAG